MKLTTPYQINKMKFNVDSDHYFNHPKKMEEMKEYSDVLPVDLNGAYVPEGKGMANLKKAQQSIQERFCLEVEGGEE